MEHSTPATINDAVRLLCHKIGSRHDPQFINVVASSDNQLWNECHPNVDQHVATYGGTAIRGWGIWETPGHLIEGVCHSVWRRPDGSVIDPTPQMDRETRILFVPDDRIVYSGHQIPSYRIALSKERWVERKIKIAEGMESLEQKHRIGLQRTNIPVVEILRMTLSHTTRNDQCPCESGRKYKKCCEGLSLEELFSRMQREAQKRFAPRK